MVRVPSPIRPATSDRSPTATILPSVTAIASAVGLVSSTVSTVPVMTTSASAMNSDPSDSGPEKVRPEGAAEQNCNTF